jgi:hypothetical protein
MHVVKATWWVNRRLAGHAPAIIGLAPRPLIYYHPLSSTPAHVASSTLAAALAFTLQINSASQLRICTQPMLHFLPWPAHYPSFTHHLPAHVLPPTLAAALASRLNSKLAPRPLSHQPPLLTPCCIIYLGSCRPHCIPVVMVSVGVHVGDLVQVGADVRSEHACREALAHTLHVGGCSLCM